MNYGNLCVLKPRTRIEQAILDDVKDLITQNFPFKALPEDEGNGNG